MLFAATFLVNAGLNFLLNLLVAAILAPAEFGRYALAAAVAVLVNGLAFTWFAMSAARFTSARVDAEEPAVRATLDGSLKSLAGGTLLLACLVALAWPDAGLPAGLLALALCVGVLHGVFDYACALARARFLDGVYARIVIVKNIAAFTTMLGAAWLFRDPHAVLAALGLSILASLLPVRRRLARSGAAAFEAARLKRYAVYAAPLVIAVVLYQAIPFLSRSLLSARYGFAETGQFSLAFDTLYRVFAAVGASLEFILFQIAMRTEEQHGRDAAERRVGENVVLVTAALLPAAVGFWLVLPSMVTLLIPPAFREGFSAYAVLLLPAVLAQCLITSALNAVFQLRERTAAAGGCGGRRAADRRAAGSCPSRAIRARRLRAGAIGRDARRAGRDALAGGPGAAPRRQRSRSRLGPRGVRGDDWSALAVAGTAFPGHRAPAGHAGRSGGLRCGVVHGQCRRRAHIGCRRLTPAALGQGLNDALFRPDAHFPVLARRHRQPRLHSARACRRMRRASPRVPGSAGNRAGPRSLPPLFRGS